MEGVGASTLFLEDGTVQPAGETWDVWTCLCVLVCFVCAWKAATSGISKLGRREAVVILAFLDTAVVLLAQRKTPDDNLGKDQ